ncbi:calcium-binding protein [Gemmobacter lutimaris]|nr:calcium-binding protein [Gemmobacter lutimaris]
MSITLDLAARRVNTTTDGQQDQPAITALEGGGFVIAWVSHSDSTTPDPYLDSDILAQRFGANGKPLGAELTLQGGNAEWDTSPSLAPLPGGGFAASWSDSGVKYNQIQTGIFTAKGLQSGSYAEAGGAYGPTDAVALDDGRTLVLWTDFGPKGAATSTIGVNGVIYNADGSVAVQPFPVNGDWRSPWGYESVTDARGTALKEGRFAVVFQNTSGRDSDGSTSIWLRLFEADGTAKEQEFQPQTTTDGTDADPVIATLEDGGFVVVWQGYGDGSGSCIRAQVFDADGTMRGAEIDVNTQTFGQQTQPAVVALEDGGFMVSWSNNNSSRGNGLMGQLFEADGSRRGVELVLSDWYHPTLGTHDSALTRLEDGRIAIASTENSASDPDIFVALFDPDRLLMGNADANALQGTAQGDSLYGFNGADSLWGAGGDDRMLGGNGNDLMIGGTGRDRMEGSAGGDTMRGQKGNDTLLGGTGNDGLEGGNDRDRLDGGAGNDRLEGQRGADTLLGGDGRDSLDGDSGNDRLDGGAGDDRMTGGEGADTFVYGRGIDRITDFDLTRDHLRLDPALWHGAELSAAQIADLAEVRRGNLVFDFGADDRLILNGITDKAALADTLLVG